VKLRLSWKPKAWTQLQIKWRTIQAYYVELSALGGLEFFRQCLFGVSLGKQQIAIQPLKVAIDFFTRDYGFNLRNSRRVTLGRKLGSPFPMEVDNLPIARINSLERWAVV
jgi:hypothetical protein